MPPKNAILYALVLGISGITMLLMTTSLLCTALVALGFTVYVVFYSLFLKRRSFYASYVGSIAGAVPPVAAYCAVTNHFDAGAGILALIFILWQMPHCYAFSIMKLKDYNAAGIPVAPVILGVRRAKKHIILFIFAFLTASLMLTFLGLTGDLYLGAVAGMGTVWLCIAWKGYMGPENRRWTKLLFQFSFICIFVLSLMMSIDCKLSSGGGQIYSADSKLSINTR